ncbi:MAG: CocE/NonD family hydrolase [Nocardioides sp.]|uniref:CocE/NonD family hydrolase n=1 Tax=Nocardioides sp. TaxID=35761 RepID=UPI0039E2A343
MSPGPNTTAPSPVPASATQVMVAMRDGVRLATDLYLPSGDLAATPVAAVLVRLPYDKNSRYVFMEQVAHRVTARGYAFVVQDVRGKYRSEGEPLGPLNEVDDGYDTIDWVHRQEWCNGRVGMFGDSYYGFTQWAALSAQHPALRAMVPRVTSAEIPRFSQVRNGSVTDVPWLQFAAYIAQCWTGAYMQEGELDWERTPLTEVFETFFAEAEERSLWYDLMIPRTLPVPVYHEGHPFDARPVPTLHCVGWFDNCATLSMRDYLRLVATPAAAPYQHLHVDSADHENYRLTDVPIGPATDHDSDDEALQRMLDGYIGPALDFYDVYLAQGTAPEGASEVPRVRWHLGHAEWRTASRWPPPGSEPRELYLGSLGQVPDRAGTLAWRTPGAPEECAWSYDPDDLTRSSVENSFAFIYEYPDEAPVAERPDVLVFAGPVQTEPLDLAGPVDLYLRVSSTAPTTDVYAKLCDVEPDGSVHQIVRGQGVLTSPGPDEEARIELGHTGYRLRPGHRLQLHLASSDYPEFPPNSGTTENRWTARTRVGSRQWLHSDPDRPPRLVLSVLPDGAGEWTASC